MADGYNFKQLKLAILPLSQSEDWEAARKEWALHSIIEADEPETCLCGHFPIKEICSIKNRLSGNSAEVGNICVKRFLGLRSDLIFTALKRVRIHPDKSMNAEAAIFFHSVGVLNDWEYMFTTDTLRKRDLSVKQTNMRVKINAKVLAAVERRGIT